MNVYAEVRGKYSRNANNTKNTVEAPCIVSRPSTSGSLTTYSRRSFVAEEQKKQIQPEEAIKNSRPLNSEKIVVKKRHHKDKDIERKEQEDGRENLKDKINENENDEDILVFGEGNEDDDQEGIKEKGSGEENDDENKEESDKVTEVSFKTTSSQKRYIEELEQMLKIERMKRIKAEGELDRLSSRHSKRHP